jgi:REP-associated tyrosine transposase
MHPHKNIRLAPQNYVGQQIYFVIICCQARRNIFTDPQRCSWLLEILRSESAARNFAIHAYCVMPDHVHFLAEGLQLSSNLLNFIKSFKLKTSRSHLTKTSSALWQKKFFDHILRSSEPIGSVAWYIWTNPVRKGICREVGEYSFVGSFTHISAQMTSSSLSWSPPWASKAAAAEGGHYNC